MVRPTVDELKADAFKLSKILTTFKVKLSSQQCLDALARLHWNIPYEAVLARRDAPEEPDENLAEAKAHNALSQWLRCGQSFCDLVKTFDQEGVNQAAWPGHKVPDRGLHWDGKKYLRAAGVAAHHFSETAKAFVLAHSGAVGVSGLTFSVEAAEPIVDGQLAILRIRCLRDWRVNKPGHFIGLDLLQEQSEEILFGAEARICLTTCDLAHESGGPRALTPGLLLTYRVSGQGSLGAFAALLEQGLVQPIWNAFGPLEVETRILLTRNNSQDVIDDAWRTDADADGKRLLKFCREASQLSDDETCDWPPYLELHAALDESSSEEELQGLFMCLCAHTLCIQGGGNGWREIMEDFRLSRLSETKL